MHRKDAFVVETSFTASIDALFLSSGNPLALAFFDEAPLHLSHHAENRKHDMAQFPAC